MKQTSIEWLVKQLKERGYAGEFPPHLLFEQAKAMEKEQIIEAYCQGCLDITKDENIFPRETSEQYYNETYKEDKQ